MEGREGESRKGKEDDAGSVAPPPPLGDTADMNAFFELCWGLRKSPPFSFVF